MSAINRLLAMHELDSTNILPLINELIPQASSMVRDEILEDAYAEYLGLSLGEAIASFETHASGTKVNIVGHSYEVDDIIVIVGTTNYNNRWSVLVSETDYIVINKVYVAEVVSASCFVMSEQKYDLDTAVAYFTLSLLSTNLRKMKPDTVFFRIDQYGDREQISSLIEEIIASRDLYISMATNFSKKYYVVDEDEDEDIVNGDISWIAI